MLVQEKVIVIFVQQNDLFMQFNDQVINVQSIQSFSTIHIKKIGSFEPLKFDIVSHKM